MIKSPIYLLFGLLFLACSSSGSKETNTLSENVELTEETISTPVYVEWNPRYTWEEFAIAASADIMTEDNLETTYVWNFQEEDSPIILLEGDANTLMALIPTESTNFRVYFFNTTEIYDFNSSSTSVQFYDFLEEDLDNDGLNELQVFAEIEGMAPADDGMQPVHFIRSLVFSQQEGSIVYEADLSKKYNEEIGSTASDSNESGIALLNKKYHHLEQSTEDHKSEMMSALIQDMGINSTNDESMTAFQHVSRESDGSYIIYSSFVGRKYFVSSLDHSFDDLDHITSEYYPLMIDAYQMMDIHTIQSARVENDVISFKLAMVKSESEGLLPEPIQSGTAVFVYENEQWVLRMNDAYWATIDYSQNFEVVSDD